MTLSLLGGTRPAIATLSGSHPASEAAPFPASRMWMFIDSRRAVPMSMQRVYVLEALSPLSARVDPFLALIAVLHL